MYCINGGNAGANNSDVRRPVTIYHFGYPCYPVILLAMNVLLKMLLFAILMILGFSAILIGVMLLSIGKAEHLMIGWGVLVSGVIVGPLCLYGIIKMNSDFQNEALAEVLEDPKRILFRFPHTDDKSEIIIADDALFIGKRHYPFKSVYERLLALRYEKDLLIFNFESGIVGKKTTRRITVGVPTDLSPEILLWVDSMHK